MKPKTYYKGKCVGEKRLSGMAAFADVDVPGGHRSADQRDANDAHKVVDDSTHPEYADRMERQRRLGL